ncbi:hypothetical protein J6590_055943 [Homalodisca vitripennis]|nr:hypothetical protein J6590_055943 [Homalodisca vitripennis]
MVNYEPRAGPSTTERVSRDSELPTGIPVVDTATRLGPVGATYEEEFKNLLSYLTQSGDPGIIGPSAPVILVHHTRHLYELANEIATDPSLAPQKKCVFLCQVFDAVVLAYKNLSFVRCDRGGARSVYGYSQLALKNVLSRVEAVARQVAVAVHDAYSLNALSGVVASVEQRLAQVQSEKDIVSGGQSGVDVDTTTATQIPSGVERYNDPYTEVDTLLRRLYASNADKNYVRDFYDAVFLVATANAPTAMSGALETRLSDKDRNVLLLEAPGDRMFASTLCESAIAFLRKKLGGNMDAYKVNYGRIFSKYRGESERNFDAMVDWMKRSVRGGDGRLRVFWFPDIENLMSPRTSADQEHIATIKNSMLQHMDAFNKDRTLRSFLLLFNSSEGSLDSAFARRLETVVRSPPDPLTEESIATQVVEAELARYHMNMSDELVARVTAGAGAYYGEGGQQKVGGFAYVQATLRDLYVEQKLVLRYDARTVDPKNLPLDVLASVLGRYLLDGTGGTLYDLDERPTPFGVINAIAFSPASGLATLFAADERVKQVKYKATVPGDPKNIGKHAAARVVFLHHV